MGPLGLQPTTTQYMEEVMRIAWTQFWEATNDESFSSRARQVLTGRADSGGLCGEGERGNWQAAFKRDLTEIKKP